VEDLGKVASGLKAAKGVNRDGEGEGVVVVNGRRGRKDGAAGGAKEKLKKDIASLTREMLTPNLRKNLEKQGRAFFSHLAWRLTFNASKPPNNGQFLLSSGYKLIGSHSGVKMCRWTKSQLRGRGGCYKYVPHGHPTFSMLLKSKPPFLCSLTLRQTLLLWD
jgi:hypothetical protein